MSAESTRPVPRHAPGLTRRHAAAALAMLGIAPVRAQVAPAMVDEFSRATLTGAGSTLAQPLVAAWSRDYIRQRLGSVALPTPNGGLDENLGARALDYEAIGSAAGVQRLRLRAVDFAVTEMPLSPQELSRHGWRQLPLVLGGVAVGANLPGLGAVPLTLSGPVLAAVYEGQITRWSDARIARLSPGVVLPDAPIRVLHRSDGSGTSYVFTAYLSAVSASWSARVGSALSVAWPVGTGQRGTRGMMQALARTPYALGYLNAVEASQARLGVVRLINAAGHAVLPQAATVQAAAESAQWDARKAYAQLLLNSPGAASYPIVATVYALFPESPREPAHRRSAAFLQWALRHGRTHATRLGYVPLPPALASQLADSLDAG